MVDLRWDREGGLTRAAGDEDLYRELTDLLVETLRNELQVVKIAAAERDAETLWRTAHGLKGAAANMGIEAVREAAHRLEMAGRRGELTELESLFRELEALTERLAEVHHGPGRRGG